MMAIARRINAECSANYLLRAFCVLRQFAAPASGHCNFTTKIAVDTSSNAQVYNGATRFFPLYSTNVSMARRIHLTEKINPDFRWEVYNLFNHHRWSNPASIDLANTQFGVITNASGNRSMQGTLKLVW
ncbi:MAG TPA: hypothetical protein VGG97_18880 [Bryobacteraceae bacterium]